MGIVGNELADQTAKQVIELDQVTKDWGITHQPHQVPSATETPVQMAEEL